MTTSFAPKLTEGEAADLARFSGEDFRMSDSSAVEPLANRGLLCRSGRVQHAYERLSLMSTEHVLKSVPTSYRCSKRGTLMLQRYQKDVERRRLATADKAEREAQRQS